MIVDTRAIPYMEMENFVAKKPVNFTANLNTSETKIQEHDMVAVVSITDIGMKRIFDLSIPGKVCSLVFNDCEPNGTTTFQPNESQPEFMTNSQADELINFIEELHSRPEKVLVLVNCKHGMCRSGAVVNFIGHICSLGFWSTARRNPQIVPNHWVQYQLFKAFFRKHKELVNV